MFHINVLLFARERIFRRLYSAKSKHALSLMTLSFTKYIG